MGKKILSGFIGVMLIFASLFVACDLGVVEADAVAPNITAEPQNVSAFVGQDVTLEIGASSPDGGSLRYQWYKNLTPGQYTQERGTAINGATSAVYTTNELTGGVHLFYVIVTNAKGGTSATTKSRQVTVTINSETDAVYPTITNQPSGATYYAGGGSLDLLKIVAELPEESLGALTYQWYKSEEYDNENGTVITGAIDDEYTPTDSAVGTYYYYVVVTNTDTSKPGRQQSSIPSEPVTITISQTEDLTPNNTFTVNTTSKFQYVRGFGGMDTPWNNVVGMNIEDYETMYHPDKLGYNIMRMMILPDNADISVTMETLLNGDRPNQIEGVKIVNKYGGYVLASPWSPPAVWKTNGVIEGGGTLKTENYRDFASYLNSFAKYMYDNGAPIYALSMQNEPSYYATYAGCEYNQAEHLAWWQTVGHFSTEVDDGAPVPGYGGGKPTEYVRTMSGEAHNNINWLDSVVNNAGALESIDILGRHIYGAGVTDSTRINWYQKKEIWMTEYNVNSGSGGAINDSTWNYVWLFMNDVDLTIRLNNESAFVWWTAKRYYSMIGDGQEGTTEGAILPRGYGLSHYAKFASDTNRVAVTVAGTNSGSVNPSGFNQADTNVKVAAFESLDGNSISLIMYTPTSTSGSNGTNMGTVKIQLPAGFTIRSATAMRSTATDGGRTITETVTVGTDRNSAYVQLPASNILSVRFNK